MYNIEFSKTAQKQLYKLNKEKQPRIISAIERIRVRPYSHVKKLVGSKYFILRIGNYRAILDIIEDKLIIVVIEMGYRKNIYKK